MDTCDLNTYQKIGAAILKMDDGEILHECKEIVNKKFNLPTEEYCRMDRSKFSAIALDAQKEINKLEVQKHFVKSEQTKLNAILGTNDIAYQSICYLRAVRPEKLASSSEAPDFHRETFYSDSPETTKHMLNIWIPIQNVTEENTLKYVPGSHRIPDSDIVSNIDNELTKVEKYSDAHKLGFFWAPKEIKGGVDLNKAVPAKFSNILGEYLAFSSMTIHGGAFNKTEDIRFVVGFGLIASDRIAENKDYYASGEKYFVTS